MRTIKLLSAVALAGFAMSLAAESKNPADYPMRIKVLGRNETTFYHGRYPDEARGEGRADLFMDDTVRAVDFTFDCDQKLHKTIGGDVFPAKWKKQGAEIVVLMPVFGKAGQFFTCNFKTDVKDYAYYVHNHSIRTESIQQFKAWMVKHDYDPVHGKLGMPDEQGEGSDVADSGKPARSSGAGATTTP